MKLIVLKRKKLIYTAIAMVIAGSLLIAASAVHGTLNASAGTAGGGKSFKTDKKQVAITVETELGEDRTAKMLEVLKKHGAKATFCVMGLWAQDHTEELEQIVKGGYEVISHTMYHGHYAEMTDEEIKEDMESADALLKVLAGIETRYVRLPYRDSDADDERVTGTVYSSGRIPVGYSLDMAGECVGKNAEKTAKAMLKKTVPGSIVNFGMETDIAAEVLEAYLFGLETRGYETLLISETNL